MNRFVSLINGVSEVSRSRTGDKKSGTENVTQCVKPMVLQFQLQIVIQVIVIFLRTFIVTTVRLTEKHFMRSPELTEIRDVEPV